VTPPALALRPVHPPLALVTTERSARVQVAQHGAHTLSDEQALAAILANHHADEGGRLARDLLTRHRHFSGVLSASHAALTRTVGAASATDIKIAADAGRRVLEADLSAGQELRRSKVLADYLMVSLKGRATEVFRVLWVDADMRLIADETLWEGTVDFTPVLAREVYRRALEIGAHGSFLVHNHPSNGPDPSRNDISQTQELVDGLKLLGVRVYDHLIVANRTVTSMTAQGLI
jgi:DNA repair protein RadC